MFILSERAPKIVILAGTIAFALSPVACLAGREAKLESQLVPQLHASDAAIVHDAGHRVILRGCNLGNWLLNELWMMEVRHDGDPKDHWQLEELLQQRFGAEEKDRLMELFRENWIRPRDFEI